MTHADNDKDHYSTKPPILDWEKFDYWKDKIRRYFIDIDANLWDMVIDGYTHPTYEYGTKLERSKMN